MPAIKVDPDEFLSAAQLLTSANQGSVAAVTSLISGLSNSSGMAGSDSGGQQWAGGYDKAARDLVDGAAAVANGLGIAARLLTQTGANHADADVASTPGGGGFAGQSSGLDYFGGGTSSTAQVETITPGAPPSANGGSGDTPPGWFLIEHLLQYTWPNGHQDQLRAVGSAWQDAATAFSAQADLLPTAISCVNAQQTPEAPDAVARCQDLQTGLVELSTGFSGLGSAANDYAQHLDDAHHEMISELESLVVWTIATEAAGAALAVFSAGVSAAAAQAAVAARCAVVAARIGGIIGRLIETVGSLVQRIVNVTAKAISIAGRIKEFVATQAAAAATAVAARLPGAARAAQAAEVAARAKYADYTARMAAKGKTPKSFEVWQKYANQVAANKAKGDGLRDGVFAKLQQSGGNWVREYRPPGSGRSLDIANVAARHGIEIKSGTTPVAEGLIQLGKDEALVKQGWQIEWQIKQQLSPTMMSELQRLTAKYPGDFSWKII